ncbi:excinuclease ABC subunit UvrA [Streptomyces sp. ST2-7A]|uniref:ATP-binding cassette domain-containing protein n=1 Tax=Streptomyces sp. ST2-7A TaxID=2907214 RepID=UPI001F410F1D|nr:excinuclease ABC subunit UvrA [Streptomyces sp. ST2-7A]MCE7081085.1 excinuclease ABC subunit UvrA [Streptomyces sp. ST2-7A]
MDQDFIEIIRARENNLKNVSLRIPKRKITVFTGVSGSGKSSLVFDTIAAESQRQLNETFSAFVRNLLPKFGQPDADALRNLSTAVVIDQKRLGGGSRSTLGTISDINPLLRLLYSRIGEPHIGGSNVFGFNDPTGMCPECEGLGKVSTMNLAKFLDRSRSLNEGAILFPPFAVGTWYWKLYAESGHFDSDKKLADYTEAEMRQLLHGSGGKFVVEAQGRAMQAEYEGLVPRFTRLYLKKDLNAMAARNRETVLRFITRGRCTVCEGTRLSELVRGCRIDGHNIADLCAMEITELAAVAEGWSQPQVKTIVESLRERLRHLVTIGLGYLTLDRETSSLSGGEAQRVKMVRHLSSSLVDMMYIFDEPSVGLHPSDILPLTELLMELRDKGNTVLVVEHDPDLIRAADHVVDIGPRAGTRGGEVVYEGGLDGLYRADTLTGRWITRQVPMKTEFRTPTGHKTVRDGTANNLRGVTVEIPTGVLTVVCGVAGAGKSSLVERAFLEQHPSAVVIDQAAVGTSNRSTPATYIGLMDHLRKAFAKANKVSASLFSFNSKGACETCQGLGFVQTDLAFLDPIRSICEECEGRRFMPEVLAHRLRGRSIDEVLEMTALEALEYFGEDATALPVVRALNDVGLDYLRLGQPLSTLSGGECQRMKLASELHKRGSVYVMDEPTTGLHMSDVEHLLKIMERLVEQGNSVIVIEHNPDVIKNADWVIELGPGAGSKGGEVVFQGTPYELLEAGHSVTGAYLRQSG